MNQKNYIPIILLSLICVIVLSSCREKLSPSTIATLMASKNTLERSNDNLDYSCRRLHRMLEADEKNHPELMIKLLSMDSMLNAHISPLDTLLIKLIGDLQYSEKTPEKNVSKDFMREIESGALLNRKLGVIKNVVHVLVAEFPLPDTVLPIDRDVINGKLAYLELFSHSVSKLEAVTMLTVLRNNIKSTHESVLRRFALETIDVYDGLRLDELFMNCNYSHFKVGDTLRASMGLAQLSSLVYWDVYIDGKQVTPIKRHISHRSLGYASKGPALEIDGEDFVYSEVMRKPGRYVRPVVIRVPTSSGENHEIRDSLVYTVEP